MIIFLLFLPFRTDVCPQTYITCSILINVKIKEIIKDALFFNAKRIMFIYMNIIVSFFSKRIFILEAFEDEGSSTFFSARAKNRFHIFRRATMVLVTLYHHINKIKNIISKSNNLYWLIRLKSSINQCDF